jgi:hypothetical protein
MSRYDGVYSDPLDDRVAHAKWVLNLMGCSPPVDYNDSDPIRDDIDKNRLVEYRFRRLHENWWGMKLTYVRQKSGGGCGSGKRFVPVSCSKECTYCHGCSPGCGRNFEFKKIDNFSLCDKTWASLWNQFDKDPEIDYIIRRYPVL